MNSTYLFNKLFIFNFAISLFNNYKANSAIDPLIIKGNVPLFERCKRVLEENDGRMLICGNEMSAYDLEYVSDELSALKLLSI